MRMSSLVLLFVLAQSLSAQDLYVKSAYAILRRTLLKQRPVARMKYGDRLKKFKRRGNWYKVRYGRKRGWVYKGRVSRRKPKLDLSLSAPSNVSTDQGNVIYEYFGKPSTAIRDIHRQYVDYHRSFVVGSRVRLAPQTTSDDIPLVILSPRVVEDFLKRGRLGPYHGGRSHGEE